MKLNFAMCMVAGLVLAALSPLAFGGNVYVGGLAPNWEQPYDYPDALPFDNSGPGPRQGPGPWDAWCTPTAAAMMMGHWADVKLVAGTGDASADGNQGVMNGYGGNKWNVGNGTWHDYTAHGQNGRPLPGPYPPAAQTDIGWYMNTNNLGANNLGFMGGVNHAGTYTANTAEGLNDFLTARGSPLAGSAVTTYRTYGAGNNLLALIATIKGEIDANRTVLGHFTWWVNPASGLPGPGNGSGTETGEAQFSTSTPVGFSHYNFPSSNPGGSPDGSEDWNNDTGPGQLGHTVTIVGYTTNAGNLTDLIVHDNWPSTVRDVQVTVVMNGGPDNFLPLDAITTLVPEPATLALLAIGGLAALRRRKH